MSTPKRRAPLLLQMLFFIALGSVLATMVVGCLPNAQVPTQQGTQTFQLNTTEQQQARGLFTEVLNHIEHEYVDETLNHQSMKKWKTHYYGQINTREDAYIAIDSVIQSLNDPYTRFFRPDDFSEQNMAISSRLFGIGVEIAMINERVTVMNIIPKSPADTGTVDIGDTITHIDQTPIEGWTLMQVARKIRGEKGSTVSLTLEHTHEKNLRVESVEIRRDEINIEHVQVQPLAKHPEVGYIRLQSFMGQEVARQFVKALDAVKAKPYLVIDLRNNAGGMLTNAVEIADLFLGKARIVQVDGRGNTYDTLIEGQAPIAYTGKIALLMNAGSASASEVLAGALRDNGTAILVGQTSYGKGMVQQIVPLPRYDTGVNLTIAHYLTPKGHNLNHVGLVPDIPISLEAQRSAMTHGEDVVLEKAIEELNKN